MPTLATSSGPVERELGVHRCCPLPIERLSPRRLERDSPSDRTNAAWQATRRHPEHARSKEGVASCRYRQSFTPMVVWVAAVGTARVHGIGIIYQPGIFSRIVPSC